MEEIRDRLPLTIENDPPFLGWLALDRLNFEDDSGWLWSVSAQQKTKIRAIEGLSQGWQFF